VQTAYPSQTERFLEDIRPHEGIIHGICRLYAFTPHDREDLAQEILLQLWRAYPSCRGEAKISTWLYRVAPNTAFGHVRRQTRNPG